MSRKQASKVFATAATTYWGSRAVAAIIVAALFLTSLPYLIAYASVPPGLRFIGTIYNIDDYCNYLSWIRQTADGAFFFHNLFTTDPQRDLEFNLLFWLMGRAVHLLHVSPQAVLQSVRVIGGIVLLWLISRFYRFCLPKDVPARLAALGFACLGSGFGWTQWQLWHDKNVPGSPVDAWQPEAFLFLSLYTSPLFVVSLCFILGALYSLLKGETTGKVRYPIIAGICGAVLGNIHSYDVLHLTVAWGLFLVVWTVIQRGRGAGVSWLRGVLALAITLPTTLYQLYIFREVAVFRRRAEVPTLAPVFWHYILGYGLVFVFAVYAVYYIWQKQKSRAENTDIAKPYRSIIFVICWAVGGFIAAYLPLAFQRKMIMGEDIPLSLLAGIGAAAAARLLTKDVRLQSALLAIAVLATFPTNGLFLVRDVNHLEQNRSETGLSPYQPDTLYKAYGWIRQHLSPRGDAVLGFPLDCAALPGATDRVVWAGHWAETPDFGKKIVAFAHFADTTTPNSERLAFLRSTGADYMLYPNNVSQSYANQGGVNLYFADFSHNPPPYLQPVYSNKDYTIFRIVFSTGS